MILIMPTKISAIIITNPDWFDDLKLLPGCLETLVWTDERLIVTSRMTVELMRIGKKYNSKVIMQEGTHFAAWRNGAISQAKGEWVLFVDSDERVTEKLKEEVKLILNSAGPEINSVRKYAAYAIPRSNLILGKEMRHAGWWPDYVLRLINKKYFKGYHGELHEQPKIEGEVGHLENPLLHLKHQDLESMLGKTVQWSQTEGKLMYEADHPPMNPRRFLRPLLTEIGTRLILKKGILDGTEGLIDGIYQGYSRFVSYARLWEMQRKGKI